jgi:photosystem II stability/assembly factor-like uncharacterized protein
MSRIRTFAMILVATLLLLPSAARAQATPTEMKLLTENTGWALMHGRLYWTADFGRHWRDITPPGVVPHAQAAIADAFFLDTSNGWALLRISHSTAENVVFGDFGFELAYTDNGGASWSVTLVQLPDLPKWEDLGGRGTLDFVDSSHGWLDLSLTSSAAFNSGVQYATVDGGRTWERLSAAVGYGWIRFINPETGWAAGGPGNSQLAVTRDGGRTWQRVTLVPPNEIPRGSMPTYWPPVPTDAPRVFLPASFGWAAVVYATADAGLTWHAAVTLTGSAGSIGDALPLAIVGSTVLVPGRKRGGRLHVLGFRVAAASGPVTGAWPAQAGPLHSASFLDGGRGWVLSFGGPIYATTDGGATWTDITPKPHAAPAAPAVPAHPHPVPHPTGASRNERHRS